MAQHHPSETSVADRPVKPLTEHFEDDGSIPNSRLPLLLYRQAFAPNREGLGDVIEKRFASHSWTGAWRAGVYSYHHYHSTSHEVLGVYSGSATLQLGGEKGRKFEVSAGDIIVIPAGVGHKRLTSTANFHVVGAYPQSHYWDLLRGEPGERPQADRNIAAVRIPAQDPLYGKAGPLPALWARASAGGQPET